MQQTLRYPASVSGHLPGADRTAPVIKNGQRIFRSNITHDAILPRSRSENSIPSFAARSPCRSLQLPYRLKSVDKPVIWDNC
jgi:hypothetical protein